jgi:hypothetical protein
MTAQKKLEPPPGLRPRTRPCNTTLMNTPTPEFHVGRHAPDEPLLPLFTEGVLRYVWHGKFGDMLVEVVGDDVFVNGQRIEPHAPGTRAPEPAERLP